MLAVMERKWDPESLGYNTMVMLPDPETQALCTAILQQTPQQTQCEAGSIQHDQADVDKGKTVGSVKPLLQSLQGTPERKLQAMH